MADHEVAKENTDVELFREKEGDHYSPSLHKTTDGRIGIDVGGTVYIMSLSAWHGLIEKAEKAKSQSNGLEKDIIDLGLVANEKHGKLMAMGTDAVALWELLDNIDTMSDQVKPTDLEGYKRYYEKVQEIQKKRHDIFKTDGYVLFKGNEIIHTDKTAEAKDVLMRAANVKKNCEHEWKKGYNGIGRLDRIHCPTCGVTFDLNEEQIKLIGGVVLKDWAKDYNIVISKGEVIVTKKDS